MSRTNLERELRRREFLTAACRLQDDDAWKEKVMTQLNVTDPSDKTIQMYTHKTIKEDFKR